MYKQPRQMKWSHRLMVRTSPFHGGNMGSNPVGITNKKSLPLWEVFLLVTLKEFEPIGMGLTTSERRAEERRSAIPMSAVDEAQAK